MEVPNFCTWEYVSCLEGAKLDFMESGMIVGEFPNLPPTVIGSDVVVTVMSFFNSSFVTRELPNSWSALTNLLY